VLNATVKNCENFSLFRSYEKYGIDYPRSAVMTAFLNALVVDLLRARNSQLIYKRKFSVLINEYCNTNIGYWWGFYAVLQVSNNVIRLQ